MLETLGNVWLQTCFVQRHLRQSWVLWEMFRLNLCMFVVVSFLFENFSNSRHCFFHKGIPECFNTSKMCYALAIKGDWMCFAYFIDKRNMAGDATLWTKKNVDLCFCFLKEIWSFRPPNALLEEPDGFVSLVSFRDAFGLSLSGVRLVSAVSWLLPRMTW